MRLFRWIKTVSSGGLTKISRTIAAKQKNTPGRAGLGIIYSEKGAYNSVEGADMFVRIVSWNQGASYMER